MSEQILIVEDDAAIAEGLALNLRLQGFDSVIVTDGAVAVTRALELRPTMMLLDIGLPNVDGLEVLRELQEKRSDIPVIVLSARENEYDKVAALRLGADDYVTKPFALAELMARIEAVLRRVSHAASHPEDAEISFADVRVSLPRRAVERDGEPVKLTHLEFELLSYLLQRPGTVVSREKLLKEVWGVRHAGSRRTVDNFVAQLRAKLGEDPEQPRHILTVRGSGYRFNP
ncbi:MAG: response regulator transcription factor [Myxococcota bacterium]